MHDFRKSSFLFLDEALRLLFQTSCLLCGGKTPERELCPECLNWEPLSSVLCRKCGTPLTQAMEECGFCVSSRPLHLDQVRSGFYLGDKEKAFIHHIKYFRRFELLNHLSVKHFAAFPPEFRAVDVIVPVPLHYERYRERSFNQSEVLAEKIGEAFQLPLARGLCKTKVTQNQAHLNGRERQRNLSGAFAWTEGKAPARVLIVDDIFTTGSTLNACAKIMRRKGAKLIYAWSLFRPPFLAKKHASEP